MFIRCFPPVRLLSSEFSFEMEIGSGVISRLNVSQKSWCYDRRVIQLLKDVFFCPVNILGIFHCHCDFVYYYVQCILFNVICIVKLGKAAKTLNICSPECSFAIFLNLRLLFVICRCYT